jgi:IS30 family transposase
VAGSARRRTPPRVRSQWATVTAIAPKIGVSAQTLQNWVKQGELDLVAMKLNTRPRKTVDYATPAATLERLLH